MWQTFFYFDLGILYLSGKPDVFGNGSCCGQKNVIKKFNVTMSSSSSLNFSQAIMLLNLYTSKICHGLAIWSLATKIQNIFSSKAFFS